MKIFVDIAELLIRHMGIDLGSGDIGMTKERLDGTDVSAVGEQVGGKTVANDMRGDFLEIPASTALCFDHSFYGSWSNEK